eukprot:3820206-Ditylum_brightwellii.AAC.1
MVPSARQLLSAPADKCTALVNFIFQAIMCAIANSPPSITISGKFSGRGYSAKGGGTPVSPL